MRKQWNFFFFSSTLEVGSQECIQILQYQWYLLEESHFVLEFLIANAAIKQKLAKKKKECSIVHSMCSVQEVTRFPLFLYFFCFSFKSIHTRLPESYFGQYPTSYLSKKNLMNCYNAHQICWARCKCLLSEE
jgi:hypothetical protein